MANRKNNKMTTDLRQIRTFSESFKIQKVKEIEWKQSKVSEVCKEYEVTRASIYKWLSKYGSMKDKKERIVIEIESDTNQLLALKKKVAELERIVGQKQILLDFKDKMIEIAEEMYGVDIKKKLSEGPSNTTGKTEKKKPSA